MGKTIGSYDCSVGLWKDLIGHYVFGTEIKLAHVIGAPQTVGCVWAAQFLDCIAAHYGKRSRSASSGGQITFLVAAVAAVAA